MIQVRLPRPYEKQRVALDCRERDLAVECAPCSRIPEAMLSWLLVGALRAGRGSYVWVGNRTAQYRERLHDWLRPVEGAELKPWGVRLPNGVRIVFLDSTRLDDSPVTSAHNVVVADCDQMEADPRVWLAQRAKGMTRYVGQLAAPSHWFYKLCRKLEGTPAHIRVTDEDAREGGAVTGEQLDRIRGSMPKAAYARMYRLTAQADERRAPILAFARNRLKIRDVRGTVVPFDFRSVQKTYVAYKRMMAHRLRAQGMPVKFLLLKYRRGGFTTTEQALSYELTTSVANVQAVTLAHTKQATAQIFRIAQMMHRLDPDAPPLKGVGNAQRLEFQDLNSVFFIGTAGSSGFGRGDTLQRVHGSEVSKWGKGGRRNEFVSDLVAGLTEAASHGEVVLETTPSGNEWFAQTYKEAKAKQNDWTTIFLPWFWDPTYRMGKGTYEEEDILTTLDERELELIDRYKLDLSQIAWRRMKVRGTKELFKQEYPEDDLSCFLTSGLIFFDASTVLDLMETTPEYERVPIGNYGYSVEWEPPEPRVNYILAADTSEGIPGQGTNEWFSGEGASDPNGFGIMREDTGAQVAAVHGIFTPGELAQLMMKWGERYNHALLAPERNNHGHAVIVHLEGTYSNLYYHEDGRAGWLTSGKTRPKMLSDFREALDEGDVEVRDRHMLQECMTFKKQKDGQWRAESPDHDDCLMKWMIAWQVRQTPRAKSDVLYMSR